MDNKPDDSLKPALRVHELPEDKSAQQQFIDRAEEDLVCAVSLYRRGACGYSPLVTICFLLHQAIEKWLKLLIAVQGLKIPTNGQHDLHPRFTALEGLIPDLGRIRKEIETIDEKILTHRFPGDLRYNETPADIERYVNVLLRAAFKVRRIVKRYLKEAS